MRLPVVLLTLLTAALAALLLPGAAAAQTTQPLVELERGTPVREHAGVVLFSRWDGSAYRLSTWRDGAVRDLPVRPQPGPFDADIGPDSSGRPSVAVSVCDASCDLYVVGLDEGDQLRAVRNANTGRDEVTPSVWKGRLAFGRRYDRDTVVPYTKRFGAPRSRPSDRLAGLPSRRCGAVDPPSCRRIEGTTLVALELWGRWVAQSWTYQPDAFGGFRQNEIRLTDVRRTDTRQVAAMTTGLGGQTYVGLSVADGRVAFFRACQGDPSGCDARTASGALRYRISGGAYDVAGANEAWTGWAWTGAAALHVPSAYDCSGGDPGTPVERCAIYATTGLTWRPTDAERVR